MASRTVESLGVAIDGRQQGIAIKFLFSDARTETWMLSGALALDLQSGLEKANHRWRRFYPFDEENRLRRKRVLERQPEIARKDLRSHKGARQVGSIVQVQPFSNAVRIEMRTRFLIYVSFVLSAEPALVLLEQLQQARSEISVPSHWGVH